MSKRTLYKLLATVTLAAACTTPEPNDRPPQTDAGGDPIADAGPTADSGPKVCPPTCSTPTPVCNAEIGQCVECTADEQGACTGTRPVCGTDHTCTGCMKHSECGSSACLLDGSCANSSAVAYVGPTGIDNATCDQATPCLTLRAALATNRSVVKMTGEIHGNVGIANQNVTILADPKAKLSGQGDVGPVISITGSSQVTIVDLEVTGATSDGFGHGIQMPTGNSANVTLRRVTISNNAAQGVDMDGGRLDIQESTIKDNGEVGIFSYGSRGAPSVARSTIIGNRGGGVQFMSMRSFTLTNNFIVNNGTGGGGAVRGSSVGGIAVTPSVNSNPINDDYNTIKFNTIVDNRSSRTAAGIRCIGDGRTSSLETNLIIRNSGSGAGNPQTDGAGCIGPTVLDPSTSPGFRASTAEDYYLTNATPITIRDVVSCGGVTEDIDGVRPFGAKCDLGADEYTP